MKKILSLCLLLVLAVMSLSGCAPTPNGYDTQCTLNKLPGSSSSSSGSSSSSSSSGSTTTSSSADCSSSGSISGGSSTSYQMGSADANNNFIPGQISVPTTPIEQGQSGTLKVEIVDVNNADTPWAGGTYLLSFSSPCVTNGQATISPPIQTSSATVTVNYTAAGCNGNDKVTATAVLPDGSQLTATGQVPATTYALQMGYVDSGGSFHAGALQLSAQGVNAGGSVTVALSVVDTNQKNALYTSSPVQITFSSPCLSSGLSSIQSPANTATGQVTVNYKSLNCSGADTVTATAQIGTGAAITATATVQAVSANFQMGYLDSSSQFHPGMVSLGSADLADGSSDALEVVVVDANNNFAKYASGPLSYTFTSPCVVANTSAVVSPVESASGSASSTYTASSCSGSDAISASTTIPGVGKVTASSMVTVESSAVGSLKFVSATPSSVGIVGTNLTGSSTVVFELLDQNGAAVAGKSVSFSLSNANNTSAGASLGASSATTGTDGTVRAILNAGTGYGVVRVNASVTDTTTGATITSQSTPVTISTTVPTSRSMTLGHQTCPNLEMLDYAGVTTTLTGYATDRYNYNVKDGTVLNFVTEGGHVDPSCSTASGTCSVTFTGQAPYPSQYDTNDNGGRAGRSTVLMYAVGEEGFTDENGSGLYQKGDPFDLLPELWVDYNQNGIRDTFEPFLDYQGTGTYEGADAEGRFTGYLCADTSICTPSPTLNVGQSMIIVMSGSTPVFRSTDFALVEPQGESLATASTGGTTPQSVPTITFPDAGGQVQFSITVRDRNQEPLPSGTTIALTSPAGGATVLGNSNYNVPCLADDSAAANSYAFTISAPAGASGPSTPLQLAVTTPKGNVTYLPINVSFQ